MTFIIIYSKKQQRDNSFFKPKINQKMIAIVKFFITLLVQLLTVIFI